MSELQNILKRCHDSGIRLIPGDGGSLVIDAAKESLTPELIGDLKTWKSEILAYLQTVKSCQPEPDLLSAKLGTLTKGTSDKPVCKCGSKAWKDVFIHDGQSVRRDCARCDRFLDFPVWYGKNY